MAQKVSPEAHALVRHILALISLNKNVQSSIGELVGSGMSLQCHIMLWLAWVKYSYVTRLNVKQVLKDHRIKLTVGSPLCNLKLENERINVYRYTSKKIKRIDKIQDSSYLPVSKSFYLITPHLKNSVSHMT